MHNFLHSAMQIADLMRAKASDEDLAAAMVPIVNSRFLNGADIPLAVTQDARSVYNSPTDILSPKKKNGAAARLDAHGTPACMHLHAVASSSWIVIVGTKVLRRETKGCMHGAACS